MSEARTRHSLGETARRVRSEGRVLDGPASGEMAPRASPISIVIIARE